MAVEETAGEVALQSQTALLENDDGPKFGLIGPTVHDDIQRAIWKYGVEAVKEAVKQATQAKRGRKKQPDFEELREVFKADALDWLAGNDPFSARTPYSIAKEFSERNPGHSIVSTHKRIERKLTSKPYDRRFWTLIAAEILTRDSFPFEARIRTLRALANISDSVTAETWSFALDRAQTVLADYEAHQGHPPPAEMTFQEIERAVHSGGLAQFLAKPKKLGLFGPIIP